MVEKLILKTLNNIAKKTQEGEDQVLSRIFGGEKVGFYIDVGAHHPRRFSNTFLFYKKGWHGINIDATPGSMRIFRKDRARDLNIEIGVGLEESCLNYYVFNEPALNSFSENISRERHNSQTEYKILKVLPVDVLPLSIILDRNLPDGQGIDFMTVDVEGLDYDVLKSNNWVKYRPKIVLAEVLGSSLNELQDSQIGRLMNEVGYVLHAKTVHTVFFKEATIK